MTRTTRTSKTTRTGRSLRAAIVLLPWLLSACDQASALQQAGYSDVKTVQRIDKAFAERDACLARNAVPFDSNNSSAQAIARAVALACQPETDRLIAVSAPYGDLRVAAAIRHDSDFRALGYVLKARGQ